MIKELLPRGVVDAQRIRTLKDLVVKGQNIAHGGGDFGRRFNDYLIWIEDVESHLKNYFVSFHVWQELYTDRYWRIREMASGRPIRPLPLITNELDWQIERLEEIINNLETVQRDFALPDDCVALAVDTNVFAHYRRFDEIDWRPLVGANCVRLIVPILVIDELDELSYRSKESSRRASEVLGALQRSRASSPPEEPVEVRSGVTMQVLTDPPRHERRSNNDDEVLARVEYLASIICQTVTVATGDMGMRLRAQARGLRYLELPNELRL